MTKHEALWQAIEALPPEKLVRNGKPDGLMKCCPLHGDEHPSLSCWREDDSTINLSCKVGCKADDIYEALGFTWKDRLPPRSRKKAASGPVCTYAWLDGSGKRWEQTRREPPGKKKAMRWKQTGAGAKDRLYVPVGVEERTGLPWLVVEGAKAADAAALAGFRPVAIVASDSVPSRERLLRFFDGESLVRLWPDKDEPGLKAMEQVAEVLVSDWLAVESLTPPEAWPVAADIADIAYPDTTSGVELHPKVGGEVDEQARERVQAAVDADRWTRRGGPPQAVALGHEPDILDRMAEAVHERGVFGEDAVIRLVYLAATSRLLARPVNVVVKGPSAGGKSFTTERVLDLFPSSSHLDFTAMSERALVYTTETLSHRMVVIYEASGMESDVQTYIIRSLLSEGRIKYLVTQKNDEGKYEAQHIYKEGPTGLITTTTATSLHPENETRMLSITVSDDADQTAAIMLAAAEGQEVAPVPDGWVEHQEWLAWLARERKGKALVVVPFAARLARAIPPVAVRLRRDFGGLLTLVQAHALLHAQSRERDDEGRIVATLDDYEAIKAVVGGLMAEASARTVSKAIRETVEYVIQQTAAGGNTLTISAIAKGLGIDQSSATRRVQQAVEAGYLEDLRDHERQPARIRTGPVGVPSAEHLLPDVEALR